MQKAAMTGGLFNGQLLYPPLRNAIMDWISTKGSCHASALCCGFYLVLRPAGRRDVRVPHVSGRPCFEQKAAI